jgi:hypothetical protein
LVGCTAGLDSFAFDGSIDLVIVIAPGGATGFPDLGRLPEPMGQESLAGSSQQDAALAPAYFGLEQRPTTPSRPAPGSDE